MEIPKTTEEEVKRMSNEELIQTYLDIEKIKFQLFLELLDRKLINEQWSLK